MVFQAYALYPHMTAAENMAFPLRMAGLGRAAIATQVRAVAETLRIADLLDRKPAALSGGQQQRVAIGRALVRDPAATLLDEPLSNLDAQLRADMRAEIAGLQKQLGATMVLVTHDQIEAMTLAERIVVLNHGRVAQTGGPLDLYHRPANRFVAGFIGAPQMNFLDCRITALGADGIAVALAGDLTLTIPADPGAARVGVAATLGIRPEHLALGETSDPSLVCAVTRVERLGASAHITVDSAAGPLRVAIAGEPSLKEGESLALGLAPARCHLFDADGIALASRTL
jgi:multiple sugar transport system ATP-binding protein